MLSCLASQWAWRYIHIVYTVVSLQYKYSQNYESSKTSSGVNQINSQKLNCFIFCRDNRESLKELTTEERKELHQKEQTRLGKLNSKSYSPGRERALKIYLDTSPSKSDDNCID